MPRNYIRCTTKGSWSNESLQNAIKSIKESADTQRGAARKFGIPESTLRDYLRKDVILLENANRMGRKPTFSKDVEKELADHIIKLSNVFYGLTTSEVRRLAFEYADKNNIGHNFNKNADLAGMDWLRLFLKRNKHVSLRRPESTSLNRITAFNLLEIKLFFNNISQVTNKYNFLPSKMFNMDETGITNVQKPPKILAAKGIKQLGAATSGERGQTVTAVCCFSASGIYVPPFFIYARKRMTPLLEKGGLTGAKYACSKNGWVNEELFCDWLQHFQININCTVDQPVLLILDNHCSHISLKAYEFCKNNGIVMVTIPPHTSHKLQPLDLTFYGPLKTAYNKECAIFLRNHVFQKITMYDISEIFKNAYLKVATLEKAVSGFSAAGIYPFNPDKFNEFNEDLNPVDNTSDVNNSQLRSSSASNICLINENNEENLKNNIEPDNISALSSVLVLDKKNTSKEINLITFNKLSPVPQAPKIIKSNRKQSSTIITESPMKQILLNAELKRKQRLTEKSTKKIKKENKKNSKKSIKKRIKFESETEESDSELILLDDDAVDNILPPSAVNKSYCLLCCEEGFGTRILCIICDGWVHQSCSGANFTRNYVCDYCL